MCPTLARPNFGHALNLVDCDLRFPVGAPELVLDHLDAVQPVLDVRALGDDARGVPVADRLQVSCRRRVEAVGRGRAGQPRLVVGRLRCRRGAGTRGRSCRCDRRWAAVKSGPRCRDRRCRCCRRAPMLPLELELEVAELILGDQMSPTWPSLVSVPSAMRQPSGTAALLYPRHASSDLPSKSDAPWLRIADCGLRIADCGLDCGLVIED